MNDWKKCEQSQLHKGSLGFYQKRIYESVIEDEDDIYADINIWEHEGKKSYNLDIQIPEELSITGMTTNIISFSYEKLDFKLIEKHAKQLIKNLVKEKNKFL